MSNDPQKKDTKKLHEQTLYHEQIGEAWKAHRNGFQEEAIEQFRAVLEKDPENVDALYGLGLAKKAAGNLVEARQTFSHLYKLLEKHVQKEYAEGRMERFFMLRNMVERLLNQMDSGE